MYETPEIAVLGDAAALIQGEKTGPNDAGKGIDLDADNEQ
jgi:hypothetical protein